MRRDTMGIILTSNDRIPPITDIRAVSYTHLDVYKRQADNISDT